jgi:cytochrome c biogenesis protein CcmG/thiol:disulfide interchange protein DsbE
MPTSGLRVQYMRITSILVALFLVVTSARADVKIPYLNVGGEVYSNLTIISVTATDINFMHSRGVANAKLKDLPPDMQKRFHYGPAGAGEVQNAPSPSGSQVQPRADAAPQTGAAGNDAEIHVPHIYAKSFLNDPAPAFLVQQWLTPKPDMAGKFVLIDFWATWCGPCRKSIPHLNELFQKFGNKMAVVGLTDQSEEDVHAMSSPTIEYAVASDPQQRMMRDVEVRGIPHAILIDPKGIVRFEGMPEYLTEDGLRRILVRYGH